MVVWQQNASLKSFNTFGMEVKADWLVLIQDSSDLHELIRDERWQKMPRLVLGGGSNVLFTQDFEGQLLKNEIKGIVSTYSESINKKIIFGLEDVDKKKS